MFGRKPETIVIPPKSLLVLLRNPDCDCCPFYDECVNADGKVNCVLLKKAADCIENLLKGK